MHSSVRVAKPKTSTPYKIGTHFDPSLDKMWIVVTTNFYKIVFLHSLGQKRTCAEKRKPRRSGVFVKVSKYQSMDIAHDLVIFMIFPDGLLRVTSSLAACCRTKCRGGCIHHARVIHWKLECTGAVSDSLITMILAVGCASVLRYRYHVSASKRQGAWVSNVTKSRFGFRRRSDCVGWNYPS